MGISFVDNIQDIIRRIPPEISSSTDTGGKAKADEGDSDRGINSLYGWQNKRARKPPLGGLGFQYHAVETQCLLCFYAHLLVVS